MQKYNVTITLESDLVPASSGGHGTFIDTEIVFDEYGIPSIPDKRVKGILRDSFLEISSLLEKKVSNKIPKVTEIFGEAGRNDFAVFQSTDFTVDNYLKTREELENYNVNPEMVKEFFSHIRQNTAIDENGIAKETSLRTIRALKQYSFNDENLVFVGTISINNPKYEKWLALACKNARRLGSSRNRGYGNIRIEITNLTDQKSKDLVEKEDKYSGDSSKPRIEEPAKWNKNAELYCTKLTITNLQKLIIPTEGGDENMVNSLKYIKASNIIGLLAQIFKKHFGDEEKKFFEFFFDGRIKYSDALPFNKDKGVTSIHTPNFKMKDSTGNEVKSSKPFCFINDKNKLSFTDVKMVTTLHHARNKSGMVDTIYNYQAIAPFQNFSGQLLGSKEDLEWIKKLCETETEYRMGKASGSEYGIIKIEISNPIKFEFKKESCPGKIIMVLLSNTIIHNKYGVATSNLTEINKYLEGVEIQTFPKTKTIQLESYIKVWQGKGPSTLAIVPGTAFELKKLPDNAEQLISCGIGERTNEGFGRVTFIDAQVLFSLVNDETTEKSIHKSVDNPIIKHLKRVELEDTVELIAMKKAEEFVENSAKELIGNLPRKLLPILLQYSEGLSEVFKDKSEVISPKANDKIRKHIQNGSVFLSNFLTSEIDKLLENGGIRKEDYKHYRKVFLKAFLIHMHLKNKIKK